MDNPFHGDWERLFDGSVWQLHEGRDYKGNPHDFVWVALRAARARGKGLRIAVLTLGGGIVLQSVPLGEGFNEPQSSKMTDWDVEQGNRVER